VQIAHRGLYVIVPHDLLDGQQIATILDHQRGWSMSEHVLKKTSKQAAILLYAPALDRYLETMA
jgi:hypothetical protein